MASDCACSSELMPGSAPLVSTNVTIGRPGERKPREPADLAIPLRRRHAEVAVQILPRIPAALLPDHHHRPRLQERKAANDRGVVAIMAVAVQLVETVEARDIVEGRRPRRDGAPCAPSPTATACRRAREGSADTSAPARQLRSTCPAAEPLRPRAVRRFAARARPCPFRARR